MKTTFRIVFLGPVNFEQANAILSGIKTASTAFNLPLEIIPLHYKPECRLAPSVHAKPHRRHRPPCHRLLPPHGHRRARFRQFHHGITPAAWRRDHPAGQQFSL